MRQFATSKAAFEEIERDLIKLGKIVKPKTQQNKDVSETSEWWTRELQLYSFMVINDSDHLDQVENPDWVLAECQERLNFKEPWINPGENWLKRKEYWEKYMTDGKMDYSYNERMGPYFRYIVDLLLKDPDTRRAILPVWDAQIDTPNINKLVRVSCSMYYNFMIREGKLDIIYHMRSCDVFEHFRNDFALACQLKDFITLVLINKGKNIKSGYTMMVIDSLHGYKKDIESKGIIF